MTERTRLFHCVLATMTACVALGFLIFRINYNGFWIDELYTLHTLRLPWREMVMERLHRGHFPGYFVLVRLWFNLWPEAWFETTLRAFSVLGWVAAVASFWPLAVRTLSFPAAAVAVTLFACNQVGLRQASEARMYTVVLLLAVWITRGYLDLRNGAHVGRWKVVLPLLGLVGFMISPTIGLLLGSMLAVSAAGRHWQVVKPMAMALVLGLLVFIPGAVLHVQIADRLGIAGIKPMVFLTYPVALMPGIQLWDDYYRKAPALMVLLFIGLPGTLYALTVLVRNRRQMEGPLRDLGLITALPLVLALVTYAISRVGVDFSIMGPPRYYLTLLPAASLLGGWALVRTVRGRLLEGTVLVHGGLAVFCVVSAWFMTSLKTEQFRERVAHMVKWMKPGDGVVAIVHEAEDGVELYAPGVKVDAAINRWEMDREKLHAILEPLSSRAHVWFIWYRGNESPLIEVAQEMWGDFESNNPKKKLGSLRALRFTPALGPKP